MVYRADIDGLRAIAVLAVVFYHAGVVGFSGGFVGVDIFFVISGFLITTIINRELVEGRFSIVKFYESRARRILPALFAVMVGGLIAGWFLLNPADYEHMGESVISALLFVSNFWFWQNSGGYFDGATDYLPMLHTWSLAVEEQFYIFFPLLLIFLFRVRRNAVLPIILMIVVAFFALSVWATSKMPSASFYLLPTRIWELGAGALLALGVMPAIASKVIRETLGLFGLALVLVPIFIYDGNTLFPGLAAIPLVLGVMLLIWAGTKGPVLASRLLALRPLVFIGLLSYSLYLWHWPIMAFLRGWLFEEKLEVHWQFVTIITSLLMAWVSWKFVERPFRIRQDKGGITNRKIFIGAGIGMMLLGVSASALVLSDGASKQRFDEKILATLKRQNVREPSESYCSGARLIENLCVFGNTDPVRPPDWILWGDSHAEVALPALALVAEQQGKKLLYASQSSCVAALNGVWRSHLEDRKNIRCERFNRSVEEFIVKNSSINRVFLAGRWPTYVEGFLESEGGKVIHLFAPEKSVFEQTVFEGSNQSILHKSLGRLIEKVKLDGREVFILGTAPEVTWNVAKQLEASLLFGTPVPDSPTIEDVQKRQLSTKDVMISVSSLTGARYIPVVEELCQPTCKVRDGFISYYRDDDHLNLTGSLKLLTPVFEKALSQ